MNVGENGRVQIHVIIYFLCENPVSSSETVERMTGRLTKPDLQNIWKDASWLIPRYHPVVVI
jgi:hypothetical protein